MSITLGKAAMGKILVLHPVTLNGTVESGERVVANDVACFDLHRTAAFLDKSKNSIEASEGPSQV
jgi:hypothetical protein